MDEENELALKYSPVPSLEDDKDLLILICHDFAFFAQCQPQTDFQIWYFQIQMGH